jgi:hypothetical protein
MRARSARFCFALMRSVTMRGRSYVCSASGSAAPCYQVTFLNAQWTFWNWQMLDCHYAARVDLSIFLINLFERSEV